MPMGAEEGGGVEEEEAHWVGLSAMDCTALFIDDGVRDALYMRFCKQVLWQAFHHANLLDMCHPVFSIDLDSTTTRLPPDGTLRDVRGRSWDQWQVGHW